MALVIFFVPDPTEGVAEMARVVCPGGTVAAYVWDMTGGGHPLEPMHTEIKALGFTAPQPPRSDISGLAALRRLWRCAGLDEIETQEITMQRTFADFEDYWTTSGAACPPWRSRDSLPATARGTLRAILSCNRHLHTPARQMSEISWQSHLEAAVSLNSSTLLHVLSVTAKTS